MKHANLELKHANGDILCAKKREIRSISEKTASFVNSWISQMLSVNKLFINWLLNGGESCDYELHVISKHFVFFYHINWTNWAKKPISDVERMLALNYPYHLIQQSDWPRGQNSHRTKIQPLEMPHVTI